MQQSMQHGTRFVHSLWELKRGPRTRAGLKLFDGAPGRRELALSKRPEKIDVCGVEEPATKHFRSTFPEPIPANTSITVNGLIDSKSCGGLSFSWGASRLQSLLGPAHPRSHTRSLSFPHTGPSGQLARPLDRSAINSNRRSHRTISR